MATEKGLAWYREYLLSETWREKRRKAFAYHGGKCAGCGGKDQLSVHHKTYKRCPGNELMRDLQVVCRVCHEAYHRTLAEYNRQRAREGKGPRKVRSINTPITGRRQNRHRRDRNVVRPDGSWGPALDTVSK